MNIQNDKYTIRFADESDDAGIREIFESGGFDGGISIQYLRNPSPVASFGEEGDYAKILVVIDNVQGRTAAVGGAVVRREYVNGKPGKCGYLTGLKIHPDYRKRLYFFAEAYRFLYEEISDCQCFYTAILDDNKPAILLLEKHHRNMPLYRYLGHYTTYCFHGGRRILKLEKNNTEGFENLMESYFSTHSLTPVDYGCKGFGRTDFYCVRENGAIRACCFVGNQQAHKQYKMCSYGGIYKFLAHMPTKLLGYPAFPRAGQEINYGTVAYLYVRDNDRKLCRDFLRSVAAEAGFALLLWGGFENHPLCAAMDEMKTVRYGSRLYSVEWGEPADISGVLGVEAALL